MAPPDDDELLARAIDLIALLERSGYVVLTRRTSPWWECLVETSEESWLGRGATEDRALQNTMKAMCGSRLARDLVRSAIAGQVPAPLPAPPPTAVAVVAQPAPAASAAPASKAAPALLEVAAPAGVDARLRQRLRLSKVLLVCDSEDRAVAQKLGDALEATVVCCDRGDGQQLRSHAKRVKLYDAVVVHTADPASESPLCAPAGAAKIPLVAVRVLRLSACVAALAQAFGLDSAPPPRHSNGVSAGATTAEAAP